MTRPQQSKDQVAKLVESLDVPVALLGVRGYYKKMGSRPKLNDINIYDDGLFVWSKNGYYSFNANTDPSITRPGVATLKPGVWQYRLGTHNISKAKSRQYPALVQAAPVTVIREDEGEESGWFGINIHRGGRTTTSSLGCITLPPDGNWEAFYTLTKAEMSRAKVSRIPFMLVENPWW
jgi:lysozyme